MPAIVRGLSPPSWAAGAWWRALLVHGRARSTAGFSRCATTARWRPAERSNGLLVHWCAWGPRGRAVIEEATRALDRGARGIKLHPRRAQGFPARRPEARADLRPRGREARSDPDPRRARPAADRGAPAQASRRVPRCLADHRARRDRRSRRTLRLLREAAASTSTPRSGARSTSWTCSLGSPRARFSTHRTTRRAAAWSPS